VKSHGPVDARVEERHQRQRHYEVRDDDVDDEEDVDARRRLVLFNVRCRARAERRIDPRLGVTIVDAQW